MGNFYLVFKDNEKAKEHFKGLSASRFSNAPCLSYYPGRYKKKLDSGGKFYFGSMYEKNIIKPIIEQFNNKFNNIKVKHIYSATIYKYRYWSRYGWTFKIVRNKSKIIEGYSKCTHTKSIFELYKVEVSKEYTKIAQYVLIFIITQLIRMASTNYVFYNPEHAEQIKTDFFDWLIDIMKKKGIIYGSICQIGNININLLLSLDNVEFINEVIVEGESSRFSVSESFNFKYMPRGSDIFRIIKERYKEFFGEDYV